MKKKDVLRNFTKFTGRHPCQRLFFNKRIKKETLAQVFSCEVREISKNNFFIEHLWRLLLLTKTIVIIKDIYGLELCLDLSLIALLLGIVIVHTFYAKNQKHFNCAMIWECIRPLRDRLLHNFLIVQNQYPTFLFFFNFMEIIFLNSIFFKFNISLCRWLTERKSNVYTYVV